MIRILVASEMLSCKEPDQSRMFLISILNVNEKDFDVQVLKKAAIVQKAKTAEHTRTERQVLEHIRQSPFLVTLHYAFQTQTKLHLILGENSGKSNLIKVYERFENVT